MRFYADLHIHSKYSRATSRNCDLEHLAIWARKKGIGIVGTGDFTHPAWRAELKEKLVPAEPGLFRLRPDLERAVEERLPLACRSEGGAVRFMLSVEISTIYKKFDKTRKIHHLIYTPDFDATERVVDSLSRIGNLHSDGRPILGLDSRHLLEIALESGPASYLVPAHIWTPWFAALGSKSGFDAIDECYGDLAPHIFAVETGLSSDPPMNWRVSSLDRFRLVSNSDAHSPEKLGREVCVFDTELDYFALREALETGPGLRGHAGVLSRGRKVPPGRPPPLPRPPLAGRDARAWRALSGLRQAAYGRRHAPGRRPRGPGGGARAAPDRGPDAEPDSPARDPVGDPPGRPEEQEDRLALRASPGAGSDRSSRSSTRFRSKRSSRVLRPRRRSPLSTAQTGRDPKRRLRRRVRHDPPLRGRRAPRAHPRRIALRGEGAASPGARPVPAPAAGPAPEGPQRVPGSPPRPPSPAREAPGGHSTDVLGGLDPDQREAVETVTGPCSWWRAPGLERPEP